MDESMDTFQSMVKAEQRNGGPQKNLPLAEDENRANTSTKEWNRIKIPRDVKYLKFNL